MGTFLPIQSLGISLKIQLQQIMQYIKYSEVVEELAFEKHTHGVEINSMFRTRVPNYDSKIITDGTTVFSCYSKHTGWCSREWAVGTSSLQNRKALGHYISLLLFRSLVWDRTKQVWSQDGDSVDNLVSFFSFSHRTIIFSYSPC